MSKWPLFDVKNGPLKTEHFGKKAYLNPIVISKKSIFGHFDEKHRFWTTFRTPLKTTKIHCSGSVRFSLGLLAKSVKTTDFHEKRGFYQNPSKCHRQTWHFKTVNFSTFSWNFCQFCTFPWGLVKGLVPSCQSVRSVVSSGVRCGHFWQNCSKPLTKPYGKCRNWPFLTVLAVFHEFPGFVRKSTSPCWRPRFRD